MPILQPTNLAPLAQLLAYTQRLGLESFLDRRKRGCATLMLALVWLVLAWRGSGRPYHVRYLADPLLRAFLNRNALPSATTLARSLGYFSAKQVRAAVETAYLAELPHRTARVWVALDAHQIPYWGRGKLTQFQKGWSGSHSRRLRGYRLYLAVDTETSQIITFVLARGRKRDAQLAALVARHLRQLLGRRLAGVVADCGFTSRAAVRALSASGVPFILGFARSAPIKRRLAALSGQQRRWLRDGGAIRLGGCPWDDRLRLFALGARSPTDKRGPWVYVTSVRSLGPNYLARLYRQRWRAEQTIEELLNGHDLDHLVSYRLHPNQIAIGFRLLARNLAIGWQIEQAQARPAVIEEPRAFRAHHVDGLGLCRRQHDTVVVQAEGPAGADCVLPWSGLTVQHAA